MRGVRKSDGKTPWFPERRVEAVYPVFQSWEVMARLSVGLCLRLASPVLAQRRVDRDSGLPPLPGYPCAKVFCSLRLQPLRQERRSNAKFSWSKVYHVRSPTTSVVGAPKAMRPSGPKIEGQGRPLGASSLACAFRGHATARMVRPRPIHKRGCTLIGVANDGRCAVPGRLR